MDLAREKGRQDETTRLFVAPPACVHRSSSLAQTQRESFRHEEDIDLRMVETYAALDEAICEAYNLGDRTEKKLMFTVALWFRCCPKTIFLSVDDVALCFQEDIAVLIEKAQADSVLHDSSRRRHTSVPEDLNWQQGF